MNRLMKLWIVLVTTGILLMPALSYAQTTESAVTSTIGYFYSASGQMVDAEDNNGVMSSYLTRGERNDGTSETFAVSNIKDITVDLDSSGNVLSKYTYTAYGTQTSYSSTSSNPSSNIQNQTLSISNNPFTYSGYYTDSESGNYYLNARYYDPTLGIFLTSDSYNLPNRDMYVSGNPVMGTDPTGHITKIGFNNECFHFGLFKHQDRKWYWHAGAGKWQEPYADASQHSQIQSQNESQQNQDIDNINNFIQNLKNLIPKNNKNEQEINEEKQSIQQQQENNESVNISESDMMRQAEEQGVQIQQKNIQQEQENIIIQPNKFVPQALLNQVQEENKVPGYQINAQNALSTLLNILKNYRDDESISKQHYDAYKEYVVKKYNVLGSHQFIEWAKLDNEDGFNKVMTQLNQVKVNTNGTIYRN